MLSSFLVRNFRSILELRLDFSYGEAKAPNGYKTFDLMPFIEAVNKQRLVPCAAFFGANAAGKTNLLKAIATLKALLREGAKLADLFEPNLLNPKFAETTFEPAFVLGADAFIYRITYSQSAIFEELLLKNGTPVFHIQKLEPTFAPALLSAAYTRKKLAEILHVECTDGEGHQTKPFLHRMGKEYPGLNPDLKNVFGYFEGCVKFFTNDSPMPLPLSVEILADAMGGDQVAALREITDLVRRADIEISAINITETEIGADDTPHRVSLLKQNRVTGTQHSVSITATHQDIGGNLVLLNFIKHESAGTQRLASLIGLILHALKTGGVFLVDELECSLHPLLMREIVLLFKRRSYNPKGAQLIFTTHNTDILDDSILRLSEIILVRKTLANGTLVRRLVEARNEGEDIRNVTNFRKQYLAGFYSGVPHPAL
jgi:ABC-type transport system involved in cytochrome c biogenesis ATPase subunit